MKYPFEMQKSPSRNESGNDSPVEHWLQQQTRNAPEIAGRLESLVGAFERLTFELGEPIASFPSADRSTGDPDYFWLICQGRARLIGRDGQRPVSIGALDEGETFGGDSLFSSDRLSYEAIAAGPLQVARVPVEKLAEWFDRLPELKQTCFEKARSRQAMLFFKTRTELRERSSQYLRALVSRLQEKTLSAGRSLADAPRGRYWLRRGRVKDWQLGTAWGYPETLPADARAETELQVYYISPEDWDADRSIPVPPRRPVAVVTPPRQSGKVIALPTARKKAEVEFPKPLKSGFRPWQNYPWIEQQSAADCGATCLAMISLFWGKRLSLNSIRDLCGIGRSGASLHGLAKAAETLGYQARPVRASLNRIQGGKNPWIAHWQGDHYVVVYPRSGDRLLVADPAVGKKLYTKREFLAGWTGYALLLDPTEMLGTIAADKASFGRFFRLLVPYRGIGLQIIILSLLIQIFGLITPLFTQIILDKVVVNKSLSTLNAFSIGLLIFGIWSIGLDSVRQYLLSYLSNRLDLTMISGFIRHALKLPLKFFESRHVGDIITRVNENEKIQRFLLSQVILAWLDFLMGFVYLGLMFYYNWQLTLLVIALIPPIALLTLIATPFFRQISREVFNESARQNSALVETISGIATIKSLAVEGETRWRWEDHLTGFLNARFRGEKLGINLQAAGGAINSIGSTALLWYGATLVIQDRLTIGQFVAFNMLIGRVLEPVLALVNLWDELQEVSISIERLDDVFATAPEETSDRPRMVLPSIRGDIRFDNVTFRYDANDERPILQNISLEISAGQRVALVGRSGSGKSTLVKLIQGLYKPDSGTISIDGHDLQQVSPASIRARLGVVPQECFLFSGTIFENISLFRDEYTLEQVIEVSKLAEAHAFIQSLPLGYNTKVGERGATLSGGQRQRIAIARALLGEPRVLLLDEATSSLDTESERRFQQNLDRLSRDRTIVIIAHRLSTVRNADCIFVIDKGIIVERGTHERLMARTDGLYYQLARQQLEL